MKRALSDPSTEEPPIEISPEADAAMAELVKIFSDPNLPSKARFRCGVEGPDEFDVMFERARKRGLAIAGDFGVAAWTAAPICLVKRPQDVRISS
jgi:hypothetical protein